MTVPDDSRRAALDELQRLQREGDVLGGELKGVYRRTAEHFSAAEARDSGDPIELWGRRIGRGLAAVAFIGFCAYLYATYVR